jgi:hypothetical protein
MRLVCSGLMIKPGIMQTGVCLKSSGIDRHSQYGGLITVFRAGMKVKNEYYHFLGYSAV